jgi:hypothetical protein
VLAVQEPVEVTRLLFERAARVKPAPAPRTFTVFMLAFSRELAVFTPPAARAVVLVADKLALLDERAVLRVKTPDAVAFAAALLTLLLKLVGAGVIAAPSAVVGGLIQSH